MDLSKQESIYNYSEKWIRKQEILKYKLIFSNIKYLEEIREAKMGVSEIIYS